MRSFVVVALAVLVVVLALVVSSEHRGAEAPSSGLAERVNGACGRGWVVSDWTVGDEYDPVPPGTVMVTCVQVKAPFALRYVAVAR